MNELQVFSRNDPAHAQGFRTVIATEAGQHDYIANWWPPGHIIGYEHEFHHAVVDFMKAIETDGVISPNFHDGLKEMEVLAAAAESSRSGKKVHVTQVS
jgi:predicted dehydrogenase